LIPPLNEHGYLPPGVHRATLDEIVARFGVGSEQREAAGHSLLWLLPMCRAAGIVRIIVNGSFVTSTPNPNDADCLLLAGSSYAQNPEAAKALEAGLPYLSIIIAHSVQQWDEFVDIIFGTDRQRRPKGMVEVTL
jgi:hypothetical protein